MVVEFIVPEVVRILTIIFFLTIMLRIMVVEFIVPAIATLLTPTTP
jgi:hypothetical protein